MADLPQKGTKLVFWNVRSMWNKLDIIKQHISSSTPQFYGLSETWLKPNISDSLINILGYNLLRNDRQTQHLNGQNKRGGGIVVYCRNDLNLIQLTGPPFTISNEYIETIVTLFQEKMTKKCYIITLYRPPNGDVEDFCEQIDKLCKSLPDRENSDIIIGGDFNINFAKNSNHKSMLNRIMKRFSLSQLIKEPTRPLYGDNIVDLIFSNSSKTESKPHCIDDIQNDLDRIVTWCRLNELTINVKKTKAQFFPRNRNLDLLVFKDNHALTIDNVNVGYMDTFRYLGVEIQSDLLFKAHINRLNKNASHKLFLLRRLRNVLTNQASILVLKSMFLGVLDYGLLFVSNVPVKMFDDLQTIQNHALRAVLNIQDPLDLNIVEMHDLVHVKMLRHRMLIQLLMCMRNAFINQSLSIISRNVVTRGNDGATFDLPVPRIKLLRKCPFYLGTLIWNQLPYNIRVTDSKPVFKSFITKGIIYNTIRTIFQD